MRIIGVERLSLWDKWLPIFIWKSENQSRYAHFNFAGGFYNNYIVSKSISYLNVFITNNTYIYTL